MFSTLLRHAIVPWLDNARFRQGLLEVVGACQGLLAQVSREQKIEQNS